MKTHSRYETLWKLIRIITYLKKNIRNLRVYIVYPIIAIRMHGYIPFYNLHCILKKHSKCPYFSEHRLHRQVAVAKTVAIARDIITSLLFSWSNGKFHIHQNSFRWKVMNIPSWNAYNRKKGIDMWTQIITLSSTYKEAATASPFVSIFVFT